MIGTYYGSDGMKYIGDWKNDKRIGKGNIVKLKLGKCNYTSDARYEGQWDDTKSHGKGKFRN